MTAADATNQARVTAIGAARESRQETALGSPGPGGGNHDAPTSPGKARRNVIGLARPRNGCPRHGADGAKHVDEGPPHGAGATTPLRPVDYIKTDSGPSGALDEWQRRLKTSEEWRSGCDHQY